MSKTGVRFGSCFILNYCLLRFPFERCMKIYKNSLVKRLLQFLMIFIERTRIYCPIEALYSVTVIPVHTLNARKKEFSS